MFIKHDLDKDFIMPLKSNRKVALSLQAKREGQWVRIDSLVYPRRSAFALTPVQFAADA